MQPNRRSEKRRKEDRRGEHSLPNQDVINPLKLRLFLGAVFSFFAIVVIFFPLFLFFGVVFWLVVDYFVLLGGTLNWLNKKVDDQFRGTGFFRRILATDARIILSTTSIATMVLIADYWYVPNNVCVCCVDSFQWVNQPWSHFTHMIDSFSYFTELTFNDSPNDITYSIARGYILVVMIRGLLIGSLIHVIHHLLVNQHLAGVRFTTYPPLMNTVYKLVLWARK